MEIKWCGGCQQERSTGDFARRARSKDGLQTRCVHCTKDYNAAYYQQTKERHAENRQRYRLRVVTENRDRLWALLAESKCADCGESDPVVLEFDHQHSKIDSVGQMVAWARPWRVIEKEIAKCEIVCCNCHQRRTNAQFGWWRGVMGNQVL